MALSNKSVNKIAEAIVSEVVEELMQSDEWVEFLYNNIGGIIVDKMGKVDDEVLAELIMCTADRITLHSYT